MPKDRKLDPKGIDKKKKIPFPMQKHQNPETNRKCIKVTLSMLISGKKPTLFYTDTLRGFRAQGCASDRHKAPRSSLEEARWGDWRLIGAQARSRKRSTRGRVKTGSACPGVCAELTRSA